MKQDQLSTLMELIKRLFSKEKPEFFAKLQKWTALIASILIAIVYAVPIFFPEAFDSIEIDEFKNILWLLIASAGGSFLTAQATTTKAALQDDATKKNVVKSLDAKEILTLKNESDLIG